MNHPVIVSSTTHTEAVFFDATPLGRSIRKLRSALGDVDYDVAFENREGLSTVYNRAIEKWKGRAPGSLLFVHDDVYLNDLFMFDKLEQAFRTYDLVGIAGSSYLDLSAERVGWHASSPARYHAGGVIHPVEDRTDGAFYFHGYGPTPLECLVVDGVFMAVKAETIENVRFDEQFAFDFYDLDFCLSLRRGGWKVGVCPIMITHLSHGASIRSERFLSAQRKFVAKWLPDAEQTANSLWARLSGRGSRAVLKL